MRTVLEPRTNFKVKLFSNFKIRQVDYEFEKGKLYVIDAMGHFAGNTIVSIATVSDETERVVHFRKSDLEDAPFIRYSY